MDATAKQQALGSIARDIGKCRDCGLCNGRTNAVPGEGNPDAAIVFVGEGPGFYEDKQGRPFVGAAGKFLDELLAANGMDRTSVYITNVVKCRPPSNRDPQPAEIDACRRYLDLQLDVIEPKVIVTLGRHSMQRYFPGEAIGRVHGQPRKKDGVIVVPMYHPAAALHQQSLRRVIEADFAKLPQFLKRTLDSEETQEARVRIPAHLRAGAESAVAAGPNRAAGDAPAATEPDPQQMRLL